MGDVFGVGSMMNAGANLAASMYATDETNKANREIAKSVNDTNLQLGRESNEFTEKMWNKTNEYNDPSAQAQRLKNAGLSSAAAAQSVSNVGAQPMQSVNLANQQIGNPMQAPDMSAISGMDIIGVARNLAQLKKERAEAKSAETDAETKPDVIWTDMQAKQASTKLALQNLDLTAKEFPYKLESIKNLSDLNKVKIDSERLMQQEKEQNIKLLKQSFSFLEKWNDEELKKIGEEIRNIVQQRKNLKSQQNLTDAQTAATKAQTENTAQQTENLKEQNISQQIQNLLAKKGMPESYAGRVGVLIESGQYSVDEVVDDLFYTKDFLKRSYEDMKNDAQLFDFYNFVLNKGTGEALKLPVYSHGTLRQPVDWITGAFRKHVPEP